MVQRIAAPAVALEQNAFNDVKQVQDNLMLMENHLQNDVAKFEQRMKTGNFPAPGTPSSFLETDVPVADIHKIDPKLEAIAKDLKQFNAHLKQEADDYAAKAANPAHVAPQSSFLETHEMEPTVAERLAAVNAKLDKET